MDDKIIQETKNLLIRDAGFIDSISGILLLGEAGVGKTRFAKQVAESWGSKLIKYQCHEATGKDELLYDISIGGVISAMSPHTTNTTTTKPINLGLLPLACEISQNERVVLLLDELDKGRQAIDNFLLDFLQSGDCFDPNIGEFRANKKNLLFIATSNEQRQLSEPLYRRLRRLRLEFPNEKELFQIITKILSQEDYEKAGSEKIKWLISVVLWYRKQDTIKKIAPQEIARIIRDCVYLSDSEAKVATMLSWFSPHKEDWNVLLKYNKGGAKYFAGMLP